MISVSIPESLFSGTDTVFSVNIDEIELKPSNHTFTFTFTIIHKYNLNIDITHKLYDAIDQLASRNVTSGGYAFIQAPNVSPFTRCSIFSHNSLQYVCTDSDSEL